MNSKSQLPLESDKSFVDQVNACPEKKREESEVSQLSLMGQFWVAISTFKYYCIVLYTSEAVFKFN